MSELEETRKSLVKIKRLCKILNISLWVIFAVLCVFWLISIVSMMAGTVYENGLDGGRILYLAVCVVFGIIVTIMIVCFSKFFSDVVRGDSPFTLQQVKRFRIIAGALVVYAVLDAIASNSSMLIQLNGIDSGYLSTSNNAIITINFAPWIAAAVVFAFSFVFKYGVLLQEFSDETL